MDVFAFLLAPFVASLILTGIHAYLRVHVVERGVIFVDLSLAQIAALGTTIAALSGIEPHSETSYFFSLAFTFIGAAIFSMIRGHQARIPQEAVIGICYAVASAAAILALSKSVQETEHLLEVLGLLVGLAHREDRRGRSHGIANPNHGFLRDARLMAANHGEDGGSDKREGQAEVI